MTIVFRGDGMNRLKNVRNRCDGALTRVGWGGVVSVGDNAG